MYLEFAAPKALHMKTASQNNAELSDYSDSILNYISRDAYTPAQWKSVWQAFVRRREKKLAQSLLRAFSFEGEAWE